MMKIGDSTQTMGLIKRMIRRTLSMIQSKELSMILMRTLILESQNRWKRFNLLKMFLMLKSLQLKRRTMILTMVLLPMILVMNTKTTSMRRIMVRKRIFSKIAMERSTRNQNSLLLNKHLPQRTSLMIYLHWAVVTKKGLYFQRKQRIFSKEMMMTRKTSKIWMKRLRQR